MKSYVNSYFFVLVRLFLFEVDCHTQHYSSKYIGLHSPNFSIMDVKCYFHHVKCNNFETFIYFFNDTIHPQFKVGCSISSSNLWVHIGCSIQSSTGDIHLYRVRHSDYITLINNWVEQGVRSWTTPCWYVPQGYISSSAIRNCMKRAIIFQLWVLSRTERSQFETLQQTK